MPTGDLIILGLTLEIVGFYFLASSIVFKRPKRILEEIYGIRKGSLRPVKDSVYRKYQIIALAVHDLGHCICRCRGYHHKIGPLAQFDVIRPSAFFLI